MDYNYDGSRLTVSEKDGKWKIVLINKRGDAELPCISAMYCSQIEAQEALNTRAKNLCLEVWRDLPSKPKYSMAIIGVMGKAERIA